MEDFTGRDSTLITLREVHCSLLAREKRGLDTHPRQLIHHTSGSVSTRYTEIHAPKELHSYLMLAASLDVYLSLLL